MRITSERTLTFLGFDFEIQYRPGLENKAADTLSRLPNAAEFQLLSIPIELDFEELTRQNASDARLCRMVEDLLADSASHPGFSLQQGLLMKEGRLVLSQDSNLVAGLLGTYHDGVAGGHSGVLKTYRPWQPIGTGSV